MMTFVFKEKTHHSLQEKEDAKDFFIRYIGEVRKYFDEYDVYVEVNMDATNNENKYIFTSNKIMIGELVLKVAQYRERNNL